MAALCKEGDPLRAFMDFTLPDVSTRASNVTLSELPAVKSGKVFGEAIARTDLINFGGTIATSSEDEAAETSAALLNGSGAERFSAKEATSGLSCAPAASGADLTATAVTGTAGLEGSAVLNAADCDASSKATLDGVAGASLVCGDLPESAGALAVF